MRTPFFSIKIGTIDTTNNVFLHAERKAKWPKIRTVIKRAKLERIPLHCFATSISRVGNRKTNPCLNTGTANRRSSPYETPQDQPEGKKSPFPSQDRGSAPVEGEIKVESRPLRRRVGRTRT